MAATKELAVAATQQGLWGRCPRPLCHCLCRRLLRPWVWANRGQRTGRVRRRKRTGEGKGRRNGQRQKRERRGSGYSSFPAGSCDSPWQRAASAAGLVRAVAAAAVAG